MKIVKYPHSVLRKKASSIEELDREILSLAPQMVKTMEENQGVGLAAPQVGIGKSIIVVKDQKKNHVFVNPQIVQTGKLNEVDEEGCLSLPGLFINIKRAQQVKVLCQTLQGETVEVEAKGLAARIFQHEIDHLNGKLIINRISPLQKWKLRKQLREIAKEK